MGDREPRQPGPNHAADQVRLTALLLVGCLVTSCGTATLFSPTTMRDVTFQKILGIDEDLSRPTRAFIVGFIGNVRQGDKDSTLKKLEPTQRYQTPALRALAAWLTGPARRDFTGRINVSGHPAINPNDSLICLTFGETRQPRKRLGFNVSHRGSTWWFAGPLGPPAPGKGDPYPPVTQCACHGCE